MEMTVNMNDYYNRIFHDYDKTAIMNILTTLKRFSLIFALLLMMYNMNHLFVMGYWTFLLYNTTIGGAIFRLGYQKVNNDLPIDTEITRLRGLSISLTA